MSVMRQIFGPSRKEVWEKLSREIQAQYVEGGLWKGDKVVAKVGEWAVTLDTYTVSTGKSSTTFTRMRAPYVNKDGFKFKIYRKNIFSELGELFGMQDVKIGIPTFDEKFIVKGNNDFKIKELFSSSKIRDLIEMQPNIYFSVKDDEGWFGTAFPQGVDELYFQVLGVIKDIERLKSLYNLFAEILNQLCHIGSAYEDDPKIKLSR